MMIRLLAIGLTYCVVSNAAYSDYYWGAMSGRLSPNATEQQVMSVVGYRPNKVELQTCGADAPNVHGSARYSRSATCIAISGSISTKTGRTSGGSTVGKFTPEARECLLTVSCCSVPLFHGSFLADELALLGAAEIPLTFVMVNVRFLIDPNDLIARARHI
jgi:hypothetical protein